MSYEPKDVSTLDHLFGPAKIAALLPPYAEVTGDKKASRAWEDFVERWFFEGHDKSLIAKLKPREGINTTKALGHVATILRSWEPKHEHKIAGAAFLMQQWFEEVPK